MAAAPLLMLGIDLGLGPYADRRIDYWQEGFVPAVFSRSLRDAQVADANGGVQPLVSKETTIARGTIVAAPELPPDLRVAFLLIGIAIGLGIVWLGRARARVVRVFLAIFATLFEIFCGLGGAVLLFLWFGTAHQSAWRNENLFLLNPLCLVLIPAAATLARTRPRLSRWSMRIAWLVAALASFALFSKILPWFAQANLHWILLFLPIHLALMLTLAKKHRDALAH
jgi:hypothetical protein